MDLNEIVEKRRSIRRFQHKEVSLSLIKEMITCAIEAPSWKNAQASRYHVVHSLDMLERVKQQGLAPFNAVNSEDAPILIVTSFIKDLSGFEKDGVPTNELGNEWGAYDLGLHNENLILKAVELGLSTLIMGIRDADVIRQLLHIPDNEIIVSVLAVGYGDISPSKVNRKSVDDITTFY